MVLPRYEVPSIAILPNLSSYNTLPPKIMSEEEFTEGFGISHQLIYILTTITEAISQQQIITKQLLDDKKKVEDPIDTIKAFQQIEDGDFYLKIANICDQIIKGNIEKAKKLCHELIDDQKHCQRIEPYLILFSISDNFGSTPEELEIVNKLFIMARYNSHVEKTMLTEIYARSLINNQEYSRAFTLLQIEIIKCAKDSHFLIYLYGKLVIETKCRDYFVSAISSLEYCSQNGCEF